MRLNNYKHAAFTKETPLDQTPAVFIKSCTRVCCGKLTMMIAMSMCALMSTLERGPPSNCAGKDEKAQQIDRQKSQMICHGSALPSVGSSLLPRYALYSVCHELGYIRSSTVSKHMERKDIEPKNPTRKTRWTNAQSLQIIHPDVIHVLCGRIMHTASALTTEYGGLYCCSWRWRLNCVQRETVMPRRNRRSR